MITNTTAADTSLTFDHADVISSVTDGQSDGSFVSLDQIHHQSFLQRGDAAADDCFTPAGQVQEQNLQLRAQGKSLRRMQHSACVKENQYATHYMSSKNAAYNTLHDSSGSAQCTTHHVLKEHSTAYSTFCSILF